MPPQVLLGTRKGLLILKQAGATWKIAYTHFDGVKVSFARELNGKIWAGVNHGHWGPKLHVSKNGGKTFEELSTPKFPEGSELSLTDFWALEADSKGRLYLGVEPAGLFSSDDQGKSWVFSQGLRDLELKGENPWPGGATEASCLHSLVVDPNDDQHLIIGISVAGVIESRDAGKTWNYSNRGLKAYFLPNPDAESGQDPHMMIAAPSDAKVLWQQNHCGIFKSEDMGRTWQDYSKAKGVKSPFGWGIAADEKDPRIAYTVPAHSDETRVPFGKRLFVQKTKDGGKSWKVLNRGLPKGVCYDIVYRHALALKGKQLAFGSTTGNFYFSRNSGESWKRLDVNLPPIYSVKFSD